MFGRAELYLFMWFSLNSRNRNFHIAVNKLMIRQTNIYDFRLSDFFGVTW